MAEERRNLAAIMLADVVGYTALVEEDETRAAGLLDECAALLRELLPEHHGQEIKTVGDAFLVLFPSALQAVSCGIALQRALVERNASSPPSRRFQIRIGLHLGDVVHRKGDVFGDGVNVVSRITPLAEPGGVTLSRQVYDHIWNKTGTAFTSLGTRRLRNVKLPVEVFRILMPWEEVPSSTEDSSPQGGEAVLPPWPGITHQLTEHPRHGHVMDRLLRALIRFHLKEPTLAPSARRLIQAWLQNTAFFLEGVDVNHFVVVSEDIRTYAGQFLDLVGEGDHVYSINYLYVPVWWGTTQGENYILHKINASRRGADMHQIFIEPDAASLWEDRKLIERLVGPHAERGTFRVYGIAEEHVVVEQRLDLYLVKEKLAFKNTLEGRTWLKGYELYFHPSEGLERLERYCQELIRHASLVEYDPHGLYGGIPEFGQFVAQVFRHTRDGEHRPTGG
ncbi:MAG: adenylate/guanylate cyclase domain-containing protein [Candidatus Bipolaricaulaceae bacterium]